MRLARDRVVELQAIVANDGDFTIDHDEQMALFEVYEAALDAEAALWKVAEYRFPDVNLSDVITVYDLLQELNK